jgi:hypothetical protein
VHDASLQPGEGARSLHLNPRLAECLPDLGYGTVLSYNEHEILHSVARSSLAPGLNVVPAVVVLLDIWLPQCIASILGTFQRGKLLDTRRTVTDTVGGTQMLRESFGWSLY